MRKYQLSLTLRRLAAISISKHLWTHSYLKDLLKSIIKNTLDPEDMMPGAVACLLDHFVLPEPVKEELMLAVANMGSQIWEKISEEFDWVTYDRPVGDLNSPPDLSSFVDHVHWSNDGCIDLAATMRDLYLAGLLPHNSVTWMGLCSHYVEDCIYDLEPKVANSDQFYNWKYRGRFTELAYYTITSAYWRGRTQNNERIVIDMFETLTHHFYERSYSIEENMLVNAFLRKNYLAVKFFWESLNEQQRMKIIAGICERIYSDDPGTEQFRVLFFERNGLAGNLLIFFLQQLSYYGLDDVRIKLLGSEFVLRHLMNWPRPELFMEILRESWVHHKSLNYGPIISYIFENICDQQQFLLRDVKYHSIFYELWKINPPNLKSSVDYYDNLNLLWGLGDVEIISHILKDAELRHRRKEFLMRIAEVRLRGSSDDEDLLDEFMAKALPLEAEQMWFRKQIDLIEKR